MNDVFVQRAGGGAGIPPDDEFLAWVGAALDAEGQAAAVGIRVVDADESRHLNAQYRGRDEPTNVLAFPAGLARATEALLRDHGDPVLLGDLVICAPVVAAEAEDQGKPPWQHWAHMAIHGTLHLLGYDHQEPVAARRMEDLEVQLLAGFGIGDPYRPR